MSGPTLPPALAARRDQTPVRLAHLESAFRAFGLLDDTHPNLTVYATGSLGRGEIGTSSDLDVFLVDTADDPRERIGNLDRIQLLSNLIAAAEAARFRSFSRDGEYLVVHPLDQLIASLGTRTDDYSNVFTARMLLLLESRPLLGARAYATSVRRVADLYWRDCDDPASFLPTFLINDIVRYWKTLCLSYEAHRYRAQQNPELGISPESLRVDLLKLKFNRVWMCFNGVAYLLHGFANGTVDRAHLDRLVTLSPLERILEIADARPATQDVIGELLEQYAWFLEHTDADKPTVEAYFADGENYDVGRERGTDFGDLMGRLIDEIGGGTTLHRFLLI